jgi:hypothetical protein
MGEPDPFVNGVKRSRQTPLLLLVGKFFSGVRRDPQIQRQTFRDLRRRLRHFRLRF